MIIIIIMILIMIMILLLLLIMIPTTTTTITTITITIKITTTITTTITITITTVIMIITMIVLSIMLNYSNESRRLILPTKSNVSTLRPSAYAGMVKNSIFYLLLISMVSCQKGPTRHAYAWQMGPFWHDTLDMWITLYIYAGGIETRCRVPGIWLKYTQN